MGGRSRDATAAAAANKAVFDAVDGDSPISAEQVAVLLRNFARLSNKPRLEAMAHDIALCMVDLGVETFGDMRCMTTSMYVEDCGARKLDAQLLVAHFGRQETTEERGDAPACGARETQHGAVDLGMGVFEVENMTANGETSSRGSGVDPGDYRTLENDEGDLYVEIEHCEAASQIAANGGFEGRTEGPVESRGLAELEEAQHGLGITDQEGLDVDSQVRLNIRKRQPVDGAAKQGCSDPEVRVDRVPDPEETESDDAGSLPRVGHSPVSYGAAASEALSIAETIAKSVQQVTQAMLGQTQAQTKMLTKATQGLTKLPKLKASGRSKPTVKAVRQWLQEVAEVKHNVPGLQAAVTKLRKDPRAIRRKDFVHMVAEQDDKRLYEQVRASMTEVYALMTDDDDEEAELESAMGLLYDTLEFAIEKGDGWLAEKLNYITNEVNRRPIKPGEDARDKFEKWYDIVVELRYTGVVNDRTIAKSMYSLLQHYQPQLAAARDEARWEMKENLDKYITAARRQVEIIAEYEKNRKPAGDAKGKGKGKGKGAGKGEAKGDGKDGKAYQVHYSKKQQVCPWFAKGRCDWGDRCNFSHETGNSLVMMVEQQVQAALAGMEVKQSQAAGREEGVNRLEGSMVDDTVCDHPCETLTHPRMPCQTLAHNTHIVMHARTRGQRSLFRQQKPKMLAQRVQRLVADAVSRAVSGKGALTGVDVPKVTKTQVTRAPTYDQHMAKRQALADVNNDGKVSKMTKGPIVDTAANISIVTKQDSVYLKNRYKMLKPEEVRTATGKVAVTEAGQLRVGAITLDKVIEVPGSPVSVVAMSELARQGHTLVQDAEGAALVKDDKVLELVPDGNGMYRMPVSSTLKAIGIEVQRAIAATLRQRSERDRLEALSHHVNGHSPKCPGCPECLQAKMHQGDGDRGPKMPKQDLEMGFDIIGPLVQSPDGNVYKLVGVCTDTGVGWTVGIPNKQAATVLKAVLVCVARIRLLHKDRDTVTVRFHSDDDKSFEGAVAEYARERAWLKTTTGGYDSNRNAVVERRNGKLQAGHRALLLGATGGRLVYEELWDVAMEHMADITNHLPEAGHRTPVMIAGGEEMQIEDMMEAFGAQAYYYEAEDRRQVGSKQNDPPGRLGVYVGRSQVINGGHRIVPLSWCGKTQQWKLGATIDRPYAVIDNSKYPLRTVPAKDVDQTKLNEFVQSMSPRAQVPDVYVVDKVIGIRTKGGEREYKVKWKGYSQKECTWEPKEHLTEYGAMEALAAFHAKNPGISDPHLLSYVVMHLTKVDEDEKAVEQLMRMHKLQGTIDEWLPVYKAELESVIGRRCRELHGDEYARVMKHSKVVKLRMNPEPKKNSRKKMRLILKGYMEPAEWTGKSDSPTAMASSIKMLVAMGVDPQDIDIVSLDDDVISAGDISTAFLLADDYDPGDMPRYVGYKPYKGAKLRVFQLLGPLYGQRDAGYRWWESISNWLLEQGFSRSHNDKCMFVNPVTHMRLGIHVDDIIARGSRKQTRLFWAALEEKYPLKMWEEVDCDNPLVYTGYTIGKEVRDGKPWYTMDMTADLTEFMIESAMDGSRPVTAPMPYKGELTADRNGVSDQEHRWFRSMMGSLQWYTQARYDIAYEVSRIAQYCAKPTQGAMKALRRLLGYLNTTKDKKLMVPRVWGNEWHMYSDSDHAGEAATGDSRSHTGVMILLNGMPIHWRSNKQPKTSLSSAEAEIYAMSTAVKDARTRLWIAEELNLKVEWPLVLHVDNAAGESFQHSTCGSTKLKGVFGLHQDWVQELKNEDMVNAVHIETHKNLADMLTKGLSAEVRNKLEQCLIDIAEAVASEAGRQVQKKRKVSARAAK